MKLIENECSEALTRLLRPYYAKVDVQNVYHSINKGHSIEDDSNLLTLLIMEYFGNPPLKFEELKENMWIWDNKFKCFDQIHDLKCCFNPKTNEICEPYYVVTYVGELKFEENRFYRKELRG